MKFKYVPPTEFQSKESLKEFVAHLFNLDKHFNKDTEHNQYYSFNQKSYCNLKSSYLGENLCFNDENFRKIEAKFTLEFLNHYTHKQVKSDTLYFAFPHDFYDENCFIKIVQYLEQKKTFKDKIFSYVVVHLNAGAFHLHRLFVERKYG
ncbi:hypothetical protein [Helicobacter valdiviensis]|nr:hypothetical protein [Helicobacter valdiviensis]